MPLYGDYIYINHRWMASGFVFLGVDFKHVDLLTHRLTH